MPPTSKQLCLIHANCQGEPLEKLLLSQPEFCAAFHVRRYVNYARETIPEEDLASCAVFLYQRLDAKWGELASDALLSRLSAKATPLCIPNFLWKGYWPFWSFAPGFDFSDFFLDDLLSRGLSNREILHIHLFTDPARYYDLDALFAKSREMERRKERFWDVKPLGAIEENFRRERLFNTINHPGRRLCLFVADEVLRLLGLPPAPEAARREFADPFPEFVLPIHPAVAKRQKLAFVGEGQTFHVFGKEMDYAEYANCYLACKRLGETDFLSFLQLRARTAGKSAL